MAGSSCSTAACISKSSERSLARRLLDCLPPQALLVADAGFIGFDSWRTFNAQRHAFLIRLSSVCHFYAHFRIDADFTEGVAWLCPAEHRHLPPLQVRIIRMAGKDPLHDVCLATNILEPARLRLADAGKMFRGRWEHEIFNRGYKAISERWISPSCPAAPPNRRSRKSNSRSWERSSCWRKRSGR